MKAARGLPLLAALCLGACGLAGYDRSGDPGMKSLVGKRFTVQQDSFLISGSCLQEYPEKECLLMQVAGGMAYHLDSDVPVAIPLPASFADLGTDPAAYDQRLMDTGIFGSSPKSAKRIVGTVPHGSVVTITRLVSAEFGEKGRCWVVYGRLAERSDAATIEIPACGYPPEGTPSWFSYSRHDDAAYESPPKPSGSFLAPLRRQGGG